MFEDGIARHRTSRRRRQRKRMCIRQGAESGRDLLSLIEFRDLCPQGYDYSAVGVISITLYPIARNRYVYTSNTKRSSRYMCHGTVA